LYLVFKKQTSSNISFLAIFYFMAANVFYGVMPALARQEIAELFLGAAFEAVFSLIKGLSVKDAFDNSQKMYLKNLQYTIAANNPFLNSAVAPHLYHDFIHQVCLGDGNACF